MRNGTLKARIAALLDGVTNAINPDLQGNWRIGGDSNRGYTISIRHPVITEGEYRGLTKSPKGSSLIASIVVELARHHNAKASWRTHTTDYHRSETIITIKRDTYSKVSETLEYMDDVDYSAIKGFTASTNGDLQLFGAQGLNSDDTYRLILAASPATAWIANL